MESLRFCHSYSNRDDEADTFLGEEILEEER